MVKIILDYLHLKIQYGGRKHRCSSAILRKIRYPWYIGWKCRKTFTFYTVFDIHDYQALVPTYPNIAECFLWQGIQYGGRLTGSVYNARNLLNSTEIPKPTLMFLNIKAGMVRNCKLHMSLYMQNSMCRPETGNSNNFGCTIDRNAIPSAYTMFSSVCNTQQHFPQFPVCRPPYWI